MQNQNTQNSFSNLAALFLAEIIRSRRTSLRRAAEISQRVVEMLPAMHSESDTLYLLTEIEKDFEEVTSLKQALNFGQAGSETDSYQSEIKEFASEVFTEDMVLSAAFLKDAAAPDSSIQALCLKYPQFCTFLLSHPENVAQLPPLQTI